MNPYREQGEIVPRPVEIKLRVSIFVSGENPLGLDSEEAMAQSFEDWLSDVLQHQEIFKRSFFSVEVKSGAEDG